MEKKLPEPINIAKIAYDLVENMENLVEEKEDHFFIEDDIGGHRILYEECDALGKIMNHVFLMTEKEWATKDILREFIQRSINRIGISIERLPYE